MFSVDDCHPRLIAGCCIGRYSLGSLRAAASGLGCVHAKSKTVPDDGYGQIDDAVHIYTPLGASGNGGPQSLEPLWFCMGL